MAAAETAANTAADVAQKAVEAAAFTQALKRIGVPGWGIGVLLLAHVASTWYLEARIDENQRQNDARFAALEQPKRIDPMELLAIRMIGGPLAPTASAPPPAP